MKTIRSTEMEPTPALGFDDCFRAWFPLVARAMALIVRDLDEGQEIAQEGFARLYAHWRDMDSAEHARNFVFRTSINLARSRLRKRAPLRLIGLGTPTSFGSVSDPSGRADDRIVLARALSRLSRRQRECVVLVDYVGHDSASAGQLLKLSPPTVRVHLARGRAQLRKHLTEGAQER